MGGGGGGEGCRGGCPLNIIIKIIEIVSIELSLKIDDITSRI